MNKALYESLSEPYTMTTICCSIIGTILVIIIPMCYEKYIKNNSCNDNKD